MTSKIHPRWFQNFDKKIQKQNHKVLLFLDNVPSHPNDIIISKVKVVFLSDQYDDECLRLHSEVIKKVHLACSEAFNVQLKNSGSLELVGNVP